MAGDVEAGGNVIVKFFGKNREHNIAYIGC
jgi:hypothetical protein